ncbi:DUF2145 domain-containing protein [Achromobacter insuavis]|uniref:DUF2145 domain-containing protein n=1 Tax=Achromobacter insuavis TaxID=1287735 RepID=UPI001F13CEDD|nr:DUF2145 domain-containing protein [Achromobacter insuavis]
MNNIPASRIRRALCAVAACGALCGMPTKPALAGQGCADTALSASTLITAMDTAQRISVMLDELPVNVVVLGRMGQDLSEYHLRYSHAGFAYRDRAGAPWRIAHLLNECGTAKSDLWYEGLGNFFLDDLFRFDTLLLIPPKPIADTLLTRMQQPQTLRSLFDPHYNMIAFPFSTRYQNSNAWVLETIASAHAKDTPIGNREQAQTWLKTEGYQPSELHIGALTRLGGRLFKANVTFDDHPDKLRYAGRINAVTVDSLRDFLARNEGWTVREVRAPH